MCQDSPKNEENEKSNEIKDNLSKRLEAKKELEQHEKHKQEK